MSEGVALVFTRTVEKKVIISAGVKSRLVFSLFYLSSFPSAFILSSFLVILDILAFSLSPFLPSPFHIFFLPQTNGQSPCAISFLIFSLIQRLKRLLSAKLWRRNKYSVPWIITFPVPVGVTGPFFAYQ